MFDRKAIKRFVLGTFGCITIAVILLCCLKYCFKTLLEDILVSIITGCVFSGIGVFVFILTHSRNMREKLDNLLENSQKILTLYQENIGKANQTALLDETGGRLVQIYYDLILLQNENFVSKSDTYNCLINHLFELYSKSSFAPSEEAQIQEIKTLIENSLNEVALLMSVSKKWIY